MHTEGTVKFHNMQLMVFSSYIRGVGSDPMEHTFNAFDVSIGPRDLEVHLLLPIAERMQMA